MMATIWWEEPVAMSADEAWAALRRFDRAHELFAPVLSDSRSDGPLRTVTFANGLVVRERLIASDDERRRLAYTVQDEMFEHHSASMQIVPVDESNCTFMWISDMLPDALVGQVQPLVEQGSRAFANNVVGAWASSE